MTSQDVDPATLSSASVDVVTHYLSLLEDSTGQTTQEHWDNMLYQVHVYCMLYPMMALVTAHN